MTIFERTSQPSVSWDDVSPFLHNQKHDLDSSSDHEGSLSEAKVLFDGLGHKHEGGVSGAVISHTALGDKGGYSHSQIDTHLDNIINPHTVTAVQAGAVDATKGIAVPQSENVATLNDTKYQIQQINPMVFVGQSIGDDPSRFITILEEDGSLMMDGGGTVIRVGAITSDMAGTTSVVGDGYVAQPYIHLIDGASAPYNPNKFVRVRYGIEATVSTMPEDILLREAVWIGETDADLRNLVAEMKGVAYSDPSPITLQDAKDGIDDLWNEVTGTGGGTTLVFDDTVIASINTTTETEIIAANRIDNIPETQVSRDVATFGRLANPENVVGLWNFTGGVQVESGDTLPAPMAGRLFFKNDTKTLYSATATEWLQATGRTPGHLYSKKGIGQGTLATVTLVDALNGFPLDATKIMVFRGGLLQLVEEGHYTLTTSGNDVVVNFTTAVPENVAVLCKWFW